MRCVRFEEQGRARIGFIDGDVIRAVYGSIDTYWRMTDEVFPLAGAKLLAPCVPKQIICVGFNYRDHAREYLRSLRFLLKLRILLSVTTAKSFIRVRAMR